VNKGVVRHYIYSSWLTDLAMFGTVIELWFVYSVSQWIGDFSVSWDDTASSNTFNTASEYFCAMCRCTAGITEETSCFLCWMVAVLCSTMEFTQQLKEVESGLPTMLVVIVGEV